MSEWNPNTPSGTPRPGWRDDPGESPPISDSPVPPIANITGSPAMGTPAPDSIPEVELLEPVIVSPPPQEAPDGEPTEGPRVWRRVGKYAAMGVGVVALSAAGFVAGAQFTDDDASTSATGSAVVPAVVADEPVEATDPAPVEAPTTLPAIPGPVADDAVEPVAAVAAAVAPSVVRIDTGVGTGSGIIYDANGLLVTNAHVVGDAVDVLIQLADGTRTEGTVVGVDPSVDVAVVQIDSTLNFEVAVFAPTSTVQVGQLAVAIGTPFGLEQSVTAGIISAINQAITNSTGTDGSNTVVEMIQTDAPINPGNSGGALADRQGRVVGINTSIRTDGTTQGNLGVGFAIPSDTAMLIASRIVGGESLASGFLGVSGQDPTSGTPGALVTDVVDGGPADEGGLQAGDLIIRIDGALVPGMTELAARIRLNSPDTVISIDVIRSGEQVTLSVTLGQLGQS